MIANSKHANIKADGSIDQLKLLLIKYVKDSQLSYEIFFTSTALHLISSLGHLHLDTLKVNLKVLDREIKLL